MLSLCGFHTLNDRWNHFLHLKGYNPFLQNAARIITFLCFLSSIHSSDTKYNAQYSSKQDFKEKRLSKEVIMPIDAIYTKDNLEKDSSNEEHLKTDENTDKIQNDDSKNLANIEKEHNNQNTKYNLYFPKSVEFFSQELYGYTLEFFSELYQNNNCPSYIIKKFSTYISEFSSMNKYKFAALLASEIKNWYYNDEQSENKHSLNCISTLSTLHQWAKSIYAFIKARDPKNISTINIPSSDTDLISKL